AASARPSTETSRAVNETPPPAHRTLSRHAPPRPPSRRRAGEELSAAVGWPSRPAAGLAGLAATTPPTGLGAYELAGPPLGFVGEGALPGADLRDVAAVARLPDLPAVCRVAITRSSSP